MVLSLFVGVAMVGTANAAWVVKATVWWIDTITICNYFYDPSLVAFKSDNGYSHFTLASADGTYTYTLGIDSSNCITIMDRNLWATKAWSSRYDCHFVCSSWSLHGYDNVDDCRDWMYHEAAECESWTYGNYYQWWNNYGFSAFGSLTTGSLQINCSDNSPSNPVSSSVFIVWYNDYCTWQNNNLWWWWSDEYDENTWEPIYSYPLTAESALARRWPCPEWYHVPSAWEWEELFNIRAESYGLGDVEEDAEQFCTDLQFPPAGLRSKDDGSLEYEWGIDIYLWSSSPIGDNHASFFFSDYRSAYVQEGDRAEGYPIRCFKDTPLTLFEPINSGIQVTVWEEVYDGALTMTVTTNNVVNVQEDKPVAWEISVSFWEDVSAKFSDLVKINVPVEDYDQVIIKVKHAWSSGYNFDWLTTNANASCDANWRPTSSQYNWELITVVNWFASIYTCEASDFVALGLDDGWNPQITVNIAEFNGWQNTCSGSNFFFSWITAGTITTWYVLTWVFSCDFGNGWSHPLVTLQLSGDLKAWDIILSGENVKMQNSEWTSRPTGLKSADTLIDEWKWLKNSTQTLFTKTANLIWVASWVVSVQVTVPAWQPEGTYVGTLVLTY